LQATAVSAPVLETLLGRAGAPNLPVLEQKKENI